VRHSRGWKGSARLKSFELTEIRCGAGAQKRAFTMNNGVGRSRHAMNPGSTQALSNMDLGGANYIRERANPKPSDNSYLHLSDLLMAIRSLMPTNASRVLDYGCGGSPYRSLFGSCTYHRADLVGGKDLDFEYGEDSCLAPDVGNYDCVLSTQVLEHVQDPVAYMNECRRLLKPGGVLLLSTHGLYEDHACPEDYWRWTVFGLRRLAEALGLKVKEMRKLTTGPRGALFLAQREFHRLRFGKAGAYGQALSLGVRAVQRLGSRRLNKAADQSFANHRVVDEKERGHDIYVAIAMLAIRPCGG
jgi:SAM-dependent methyltransferase